VDLAEALVMQMLLACTLPLYVRPPPRRCVHELELLSFCSPLGALSLQAGQAFSLVISRGSTEEVKVVVYSEVPQRRPRSWSIPRFHRGGSTEEAEVVVCSEVPQRRLRSWAAYELPATPTSLRG